MKKMVKIRYFTEITLETFGNCMTIPLNFFVKTVFLQKINKFLNSSLSILLFFHQTANSLMFWGFWGRKAENWPIDLLKKC